MPKKTPTDLPQSDTTWFFFTYRLRTWIAEEDKPPVRPYLTLIFDLSGDGIRGFNIGEKPTPAEAQKLLFKAMTKPEIGREAQPERPARLFCEEKEWQQALRPALQEIGVECRHRPQTELSQALVADLEKHMHDDAPPLPGLLGQKGVNPRLVGAFFEAAAGFYRAAPWVQLGNEHLLALSVPPQKEPYYATVMGQGGVEYGLGVYHSWEEVERQYGSYDRLEDLLAGEGRHVMFFNEITEVPFDDLDALEIYHWELAGPQAYPVPLVFTLPAEVRRPTRDELLWYEAVLGAIPRFVQEHLAIDAQGQPQPAEAHIPVTTSAGKVQVWVKFPGGELPRERALPMVDFEVEDDDETEFAGPPFERRAMEADMARMTAGLGETALDEKTAQAQELMYEAWEADNPAERLALAHQALKISPDCADAYVLLAEEEDGSLAGALELYQQGVEAGRRALGEAYFEENAGHFWGLLETRPFMRAMDGLASSLWQSGRWEEALATYREMLRLNPGDNQGIRYVLADLLLDLNRDVELGELLTAYGGEPSAVWQYTQALYLYRREGSSKKATSALRQALEGNPYLLRYLTGEKRIPNELPEYIGMGDENEAVVYAAHHLNYWRRTPGALDWLQQHAAVAQKALKKKSRKPRRPKVRFRVGDTVRVKPGVKDPDNDAIELSGWQGQVIEIEEGEEGMLVLIAWDAETLAQMPPDSIDAAMDEGYDWSLMYLEEGELSPAEPRSGEDERQAALERLERDHAWGHLGAQGKRIRAVLQGLDLDDEQDAMLAWEAHLRRVLKLPFEAEVAELAGIEDLDLGTIVQVTGFAPLDELEGVMVQVDSGAWQGAVALVNLEPTKRRSANYRHMDDYLVWFSEI